MDLNRLLRRCMRSNVITPEAAACIILHNLIMEINQAGRDDKEHFLEYYNTSQTFYHAIEYVRDPDSYDGGHDD